MAISCLLGSRGVGSAASSRVMERYPALVSWVPIDSAARKASGNFLGLYLTGTEEFPSLPRQDEVSGGVSRYGLKLLGERNKQKWQMMLRGRSYTVKRHTASFHTG